MRAATTSISLKEKDTQIYAIRGGEIRHSMTRMGGAEREIHGSCHKLEASSSILGEEGRGWREGKSGGRRENIPNTFIPLD